MPRPKGSFSRQPKYRLHKATGQAIVTIAGRDHYLGEYDSRESREKYYRLIHEWHARGLVSPSATPQTTTIEELIAAFWTYVKERYATSGSWRDFKTPLRVLREMYASLPVAEFSPLKLKALRQAMTERECRNRFKGGLGKNWSRKYVNTAISYIKQMFSWAAANDLVPGSTFHALLAVRPLRRGEGELRELPSVKSVDDAVVERVLPFLSETVRGMVQLQRHTGMRGGEVRIMRGCDIDMADDGCWLYRPERHKGTHLEKDRVIGIGPRAQEILRPFLKPNPTAYLFSPADAIAARDRRRREHAKTPLESLDRTRAVLRDARRKRGARKETERLKPVYSAASYAALVMIASDVADAAAHRARPEVPAERRLVPRFHPHQLRHSYATEVNRTTRSRDLTRIALGHSDEKMTALYIDENADDVKHVVGKVG